MYTYTLRVCTGGDYHRSNNYSSESYIYEVREYKRIRELAEQGNPLINCYMYRIQLIYFDSKKGRKYVKFKNFSNTLKAARKSVRFKMKSIEKSIEMESKGYVVSHQTAYTRGRE